MRDCEYYVTFHNELTWRICIAQGGCDAVLIAGHARAIAKLHTAMGVRFIGSEAGVRCCLAINIEQATSDPHTTPLKRWLRVVVCCPWDTFPLRVDCRNALVTMHLLWGCDAQSYRAQASPTSGIPAEFIYLTFLIGQFLLESSAGWYFSRSPCTTSCSHRPTSTIDQGKAGLASNSCQLSKPTSWESSHQEGDPGVSGTWSGAIVRSCTLPASSLAYAG